MSKFELMGRKVAATLMRRLPVQVRRIRVLRDKAYIALGAGGWDDNDELDRRWPSALQMTRGRRSGMRMKLDLTDWLQRRAYFTGRFYQEDLEDLLRALLRSGDNFVDIGANIGLVTLHAAPLVGQKGSLWAFEPNPEAFARLAEHMSLNGLQARLFNAGLGSEVSTLTLRRFGRHTGKATLVERPDALMESVSVSIVRGDEALEKLDVSKPTVFKIDVEGFEVPVLQGLGNLLDHEIAVIIEVSPTWLKLAGSSAELLYRELERHGLKPYRFRLQEGRFTRKLNVASFADRPTEQYDCLFMRPDSIFARRLGV
jgi:FkbM family methyltransferase